MQNAESRKAAPFRTGWVVFWGLAALTAVEFAISAAAPQPLPFLAAIALIKAWLIVRFFMHVLQLWKREA